MDCPFAGKYPHRLFSDGTARVFYSVGSFWDYSEPLNTKSSTHYGFMIARGVDELVEEGSYDEPSIYEPCEEEMIIVRPKMKYPKR